MRIVADVGVVSLLAFTMAFAVLSLHVLVVEILIMGITPRFALECWFGAVVAMAIAPLVVTYWF